MPKFKIVVTDDAKRDLRQIERNLRQKILQKFKILETSPFPTIKPVKKIEASCKIPLFRLRAGDYRIIYHVRGRTVGIITIVHRKDFDNAVKTQVKVLAERMRTGRYFGFIK